MRVIAGKWGGRRLVSFKAQHIRPTTDRVKGSIFNRLMHQIEGARVLDLYSGTGSLGIEALSRGAERVIFVESHRQSAEIIRKNLVALQSKDGWQIEMRSVDAFLGGYRGQVFDIVLADPPFTAQLADGTMKSLSQSRAVGPGTKVIIEAGAKEVLQEEYGCLKAHDIRNYGDKKVGFFTCVEPGSPLKK